MNQSLPWRGVTKLERMKSLCDAATQGEWETDTIRNDGEYGDGEDTHSGFNSYAMYDSKGLSLFDSLNSQCCSVDCDIYEDGGSAWDETAKRNFAFIAAMNPVEGKKLLKVMEAVEELRKAVASQYLTHEATINVIAAYNEWSKEKPSRQCDETLVVAIATESDDRCEWSDANMLAARYNASCGLEAIEHKYKYCPTCGKPIKEVVDKTTK